MIILAQVLNCTINIKTRNGEFHRWFFRLWCHEPNSTASNWIGMIAKNTVPVSNEVQTDKTCDRETLLTVINVEADVAVVDEG